MPTLVRRWLIALMAIAIEAIRETGRRSRRAGRTWAGHRGIVAAFPHKISRNAIFSLKTLRKMRYIFGVERGD